MTPRTPAILEAVAVALCVLCFLGPWFSEDMVAGGNVPQMSWEEGLFGYSWTGPPAPVVRPGATVTIYYNYTLEPGTAGLFLATAGIEALGLVCGVASVVVLDLGRPRPRLAGWAPWLTIGGSVFLAVSPILVMIFLPAAQAADAPGSVLLPGFWGSVPYATHATGEGTMFFGPGWAWYLSWVAAALFVASALLLIKERREAGTTRPEDNSPVPV